MKILVIEDNQKHLNDAKAFFASIAGLEVVYAEDGLNISQKITGVDGVISDIFFPLSKGDSVYGKEEPIGVGVLIRCREIKLPCVLNTAGYHHGSRYEWINQLIRDLNRGSVWCKMVDAGNPNMDGETKDWATAFEILNGFIESKEKNK